jgi:ABC-2 type transport system permease protein
MKLRLGMRLQRVGLISVVILGAVMMLAQTTGWESVAGHTTAQRLAFAQRMEPLGRQLSYLIPLPRRLDTMGGYLQWRGFGFMPVVLAFWAVVAAAGAVRGDEERGLLAQWLATGMSRVRYMSWRFATFAVAAIVACTYTCLVAWYGTWRAHETVGAASFAAELLVLVALALACYGIAMLVAQLAATRRAAGGLAATVILVLFLINSLGRSMAGLHPWRWLSPFSYADSSSPLVPGGHLDVGATVVLVVVALVAAGLAAMAFARRDVGAALFARRARVTPAVRVPATNPLFRQPVLPALWERRGSLAGWLVGIILAGLAFGSLTKTTLHLVQTTPSLRPYLTAAGGATGQSMVGFFWFGVFQLVLAVYAILQVGRWAADDAEGRLEMILAAPVRRSRVVLERAASLTVSLVLLVAVGTAVTAASAVATHISLSSGALANASWLQVVSSLTFAAVGGAVVGVSPRITVGVLAVVAAGGYLLRDFAPLLSWPKWVGHLSVFSLYGTPLGNGVYWTGAAIMLAVVVAGFGAALATMHRREVGR